jgi:hypothetical protein
MNWIELDSEEDNSGNKVIEQLLPSLSKNTADFKEEEYQWWIIAIQAELEDWESWLSDNVEQNNTMEADREDTDFTTELPYTYHLHLCCYTSSLHAPHESYCM